MDVCCCVKERGGLLLHPRTMTMQARALELFAFVVDMAVYARSLGGSYWQSARRFYDV